MIHSQRKKRENIFEPMPLRSGRFEVEEQSDLEWHFTNYGIEAEQSKIESPAPLKIGFFYLLLLLSLSVLSFRLFNIQVARGFEYRLQAEGNRIRSHLFEASRGSILDRNGEALVTNIADYALLIYPYNLPARQDERQQILDKITSVTGYQGDIADQINKAKSRGFEPAELISNINREEALKWKVLLSDISAVSVSAQPKRSYRVDLALAHIVGYVGKLNDTEVEAHPDYPLNSSIGKTGLEYTYDAQLRGQPGEEKVEIDSAGYLRRLITTLQPEIGNSLQLYLDNGLQKVLADNLKTALEKSSSKSGVAIAMDPRSGGILSMVSLPDYDTNIFSGRIDQAKYKEITNDPNKPLLNRAIAGNYPPGSTIKPFVATGALEAGVINEQTTLLTPSELKVGEWIFPDWKAHGSANVEKAIAESNNVFFYIIGGGYDKIGGLGADRLGFYMKQFNFDNKTGIDLPGERGGFIPSPSWKEKTKKEKWYVGDTYHMAIGQGDILVTPIEIAAATAAIANGGTLYEPKLAQKIISSDKKNIQDIAPTIKKSNIASGESLRIVRDGMRQAIASGSGYSTFGDDFPVAVAGKTGTAQFGGEGKTHAWFTSFAPYDDPKIVITVFIEGGGEGYAVAAPVAKAAYEWYATHIETLP
jgi:penicillin-binding protein 2